MSARRGFVLFLLLAGCGAAAGPETWLAETGAAVERDGAGRITGVSLRARWVSDLDLENLQRLPALARLDLSYTRITDRGLERLKPLAGVRELNLQYAELVTDEGLAHLKGWKALRRVNVRGTKITDSGLEHLSQIATLEEIDAGFAELTSNGFDALAALPRLRRLAIGGNKLSDAAAQALRSLPHLRALDLSGAQRTDSGLWFVALTDAGMEAIGALAELEELNLAGIRIQDLSLRHLARLKRLRVLDLSRTPVTAAGLDYLKALPVLERLSLWKAERIHDAAVPVLLGLRSLRELDVAETALSPPAAAKLRARFP